MSGYYFPLDLDIEDVKSPIELLLEAQSDWRSTTRGTLDLIFQSNNTTSGHERIAVYALYVPIKRTCFLFSILHMPNLPYPSTIMPPANEVPDFLKKSYLSPAADLAETYVRAGLKGTEKTIENRWVAETPSELRIKLREAFGLGTVKSSIINLVAMKAPADDPAETEDSSNAE